MYIKDYGYCSRISPYLVTLFPNKALIASSHLDRKIVRYLWGKEITESIFDNYLIEISDSMRSVWLTNIAKKYDKFGPKKLERALNQGKVTSEFMIMVEEKHFENLILLNAIAEAFPEENRIYPSGYPNSEGY